MAYCTHDEIERLVGPDQFAQMLDDNRDGLEDDGLFDLIADDASLAVDGYLSAQYGVPFSSPPAFVRLCAKVFCAEMLFERRGVAKDANPWTSRADSMRARLERIAAGDDILDAASLVSSDSVEVETEPSKLAQEDGRLMF